MFGWISKVTWNNLLINLHTLKTKYSLLSMDSNRLKYKVYKLERKLNKVRDDQQQTKQELKNLKRHLTLHTGIFTKED